MEISITGFSNTRPVYFVIHVSLAGHTSYVLRKRYSDFAAFAADVESEMGEPTPMSLPEKKWLGNTNEEFLKERRRRLELFLRQLIKQEEWREALALQKFLETAAHMRSDSRMKNNLQSATEWAKAVSEVRTMIQHIREAAGTGTGASEIPGSFSRGSAGTAEERKLHLKARSKLQELEGSLIGNNNLGEGEYMRRRNIYQDLARALAQTETARRNSIINGSSIDDITGDGGFDKPTNASNTGSLNSKLTQSLFGKLSNTRPNGGRVLGVSETDQTRQLNNSGLLQLQDQEMSSQDDIINSLRSTIRTQRDLGQQIYEELEHQNKMLDDLDQSTHTTNAKMNQARRRVKKFT